MGGRLPFGRSEPRERYNLRGLWTRDTDIQSSCNVLLHRHAILPAVFKLLYNSLCKMDMSNFLLSSFIPPSSNRVPLSFLPLHTVLVGLLLQVPTHPRSRLAHGPSSAHEMLSSKNLKVKQMTQ